MDSFGFRLKNKNFILFSLFCFVLALYRLAKRKHLNGKWFILRAQNELMRFMNTHICRLMLSIIELMTEFASAPRLRARWWRLRSDNCPQERQQCFSRKYCPSGERVEAFHHDMRTGDNYANGISPARRRNVNSPFYLRQHNQRRCMVGVCQIDTKKQCDKSAIQIFNVFYFVCYNCHARVKINRFVVIMVLGRCCCRLVLSDMHSAWRLFWSNRNEMNEWIRMTRANPTEGKARRGFSVFYYNLRACLRCKMSFTSARSGRVWP